MIATANHLTLNTSKTEFLLIILKQQPDKIQNSSLNTTHSARNLGFIFDEQLAFSDQITASSKSCCSHILGLSCIRPYLYFKTASIVQSKLDYRNSLYYNLPHSQLTRLQQIQNCLARAVVAPKFTHTTSIFKSLHWLKSINVASIRFFCSFTYKVLTTAQPGYFPLTYIWPHPNSDVGLEEREYNRTVSVLLYCLATIQQCKLHNDNEQFFRLIYWIWLRFHWA